MVNIFCHINTQFCSVKIIFAFNVNIVNYHETKLMGLVFHIDDYGVVISRMGMARVRNKSYAVCKN